MNPVAANTAREVLQDCAADAERAVAGVTREIEGLQAQLDRARVRLEANARTEASIREAIAVIEREGGLLPRVTLKGG